jgi:hypothetical protein
MSDYDYNCMICKGSSVFWQRSFDLEEDRWFDALFNCPHCKRLRTEPTDMEWLRDCALALAGTALKKIEAQLEEADQMLKKASTLLEEMPEEDQELAASSAVVQRIQEKSAALAVALNALNKEI